jgi:hypothetical protein
MLPQTLVTVLLPTKRRVPLVIKSVESVLSLANNPTAIEIAVAYDEDDNESDAFFHSNDWRQLIDRHGAQDQVFKTPKWGYVNLHNYYNLMSEKANGKWLLIWNDDATLITAGWDQYVADAGDYMGMLHIGCTTYPKLSLFPIFSRQWLNLFGTASLSNHIDSWIADICTIADAIKDTPIQAYHDRYSETGNNNDQTYQERSRAGKKIYKSQEMKDVRAAWAEKLINYRHSLDVLPHVSPALT